MEEIRYPIGRLSYTSPNTSDHRKVLIRELEQGPEILQRAVDGLSAEQIDSRYREEGWTLRQVVHHVADSHLNGYLRFKWTMAEENPTIKTYDQKKWAELPDSKQLDVEVSLKAFAGIHQRWAGCLRILQPSDFEKFFIHPETGKEWTIDFSLTLYAWHGKHHAAQIT